MATDYTNSLVVVWPAALTASVQALNSALGYDSGAGIPLFTSGGEPPTHRGLHTWATPEYVAIATGQAIPDPLPDGVTAQDITDLLAAITVSVDPVSEGVTLTKRAHFEHVIAGLGLSEFAGEA